MIFMACRRYGRRIRTSIRGDAGEPDKGNWHNLLRYGIARKREQEQEFTAGGNYLDSIPGTSGQGTWQRCDDPWCEWIYATGQVQLYTGNNDDQASQPRPAVLPERLQFLAALYWAVRLSV